jgi:hypothetical protein
VGARSFGPFWDKAIAIATQIMPLDRHRTWIFRIAFLFAFSIAISLCGIEFRDRLGREMIRDFIDMNRNGLSILVDGQKIPNVDDYLQALRSTRLVFHGAGTSHPTNRVTIMLSAANGEQVKLVVSKDSKDPTMYWVFYPHISEESPIGWTFSDVQIF